MYFVNSKEIEDEFHFVLVCPANREKYIKHYYYKKKLPFSNLQLLRPHQFDFLVFGFKAKSGEQLHFIFKKSFFPLKYMEKAAKKFVTVFAIISDRS